MSRLRRGIIEELRAAGLEPSNGNSSALRASGFRSTISDRCGRTTGAGPDPRGVSQRTSRIRLGIGVVLAPIHHPLHVAARMATLDILSHGGVRAVTHR